MKFSAFIVGMLLSISATGQVKDMGSAFEAGKQFANTGKTSAGSMVNSNTGSQQLPNYNTNAPESGNFGGGKSLITGIGNSKVINCRNYKAPDAFNQQECDAVNFLAKNTSERPKFDLDKNDPIIGGSGDIIKNPGAGGGTNSQQCRVEVERIPAKFMEETCTQTNYIEEGSCKRNLIVECSGGDGNCALGGIVPGSVSVDMGNYTFDFNGETLIVENNFTGANSHSNANFDFQIKNLKDVSVFSIVSMASDNWASVSVNGKFLGTHSRRFGGLNTNSDRLYINWDFEYCPPNPNMSCLKYPAVVYGAGKDDFHQMEQGDRFEGPVTLDLKPYLVEGLNRISMYVVNGGGPGNGRVVISTRVVCPLVCREYWDDSQCFYYTNR